MNPADDHEKAHYKKSYAGQNRPDSLKDESLVAGPYAPSCLLEFDSALRNRFVCDYRLYTRTHRYHSQ
jgi:hypothetical protein